ncbi:MAG: hypothetical protein IJN37_02070 [Clostridia bacterium]|nr:hypothetical protein [Clostridia bacterium]
MVKKKRYIEPMSKSWVEDATKLIKFKDDRLRVQAELLDHIEDAADAWKEAGYDDYEAKKKAVSNMGDAAEVANNLADIYRPFWGRLWKLTKIVRNLLIVFLAYAIISKVYDYTFIINTTHTSVDLLDRYPHSEYKSLDLISNYNPNESVKVGDYTITLKQVVVRDKSLPGKIFNFLLEFKSFAPYVRYPDLIDSSYLKDDLGNFYYPYWRETNGYLTSEAYYYFTGQSDHILPSLSYNMFNLLMLHEDATQVTIIYDRFGEYFEFTVPVYGGVEHE